MRTSLVAVGALAIAGCAIGSWGSRESPSSGEGTPTAGSAVLDAGPPVGAPDFGATTTQSTPPPPISGGTLALTSDGATAVVADPDRDAVYIVDFASSAVKTIALQPGDEPGRVAIDDAGRAHVALRRGGALATIDLASASVIARRAVCPEPRGVAFDAHAGAVRVACAGGELVMLPPAGGAATRTVQLGADLRDVVVKSDGSLRVTTFRSGEVLVLTADGALNDSAGTPFQVLAAGKPDLTWRAISTPSGDLVTVHQQVSLTIDNQASASGSMPPGGGYTASSGCDGQGAVTSVVTDLDSFASVSLPGAVLPVDIAVSPSGTTYAVVAAGNGHAAHADSLIVFDATSLPTSPGASGCIPASAVPGSFGQLTSVAFRNDGAVVAFSREPAQLIVVPAIHDHPPVTIPLSSISREDTGHAIFHSDTGRGIACASCHAEGGEDGQVWTFIAQGTRRTPSLRGTLAGTAPYHWSGELADVPALAAKVYEQGMGGPALGADQTRALQSWLFAIPAPPARPATDADAAARGKALFEGQALCATCHTGPRFTNNATVDVGTGGAFQVPPLVGVSLRTPLLHTGCAATLADRFGACGGGDHHGKTSDLSASQIADLVAYLETL